MNTMPPDNDLSPSHRLALAASTDTAAALEASVQLGQIPTIRNAFDEIAIDIDAAPLPAAFFAAVKRKKRGHAIVCLAVAVASGSILPLLCMIPKHILDAHRVFNGILFLCAGLPSVVICLAFLLSFAVALMKNFEAACFEAEIFINHEGIRAIARKNPLFEAYEQSVQAQGRPLSLREAEAFYPKEPYATPSDPAQPLVAQNKLSPIEADARPKDSPPDRSAEELCLARAQLAATQAKLAAAEIEIMHAGQYPAREHPESRDGLALAARLNESSRDVLAAVDQASRQHAHN